MNNATIDYKSNHFGQVLLTAGSLASIARSPEIWSDILSFHHLLASDEYVQYVDAFYREGVRRFGQAWDYMDITTLLYAAGKTIRPKSYLEIGVRRGRSASVVARSCPTVDIVAFDMWLENYAGMENPGPEFVKTELARHGHVGEIYFVNGNSHQTIPAFIKNNPELSFDLITVDGDHTEEGALDDLMNVIPRLAVGGVIVFDDISHPAHQYLLNVWRRAMNAFPNLDHFEFCELGYGVAFAIRKR